MTSHSNSELRLTDTNAASDSKGRTWGLEGNLFWWLIGGLGAGIAVFFVALVWLDSSLLTSLLLGAVPAVLALAYVFGLRQGRPPGFDRDLAERVFRGEGFSPQSDRTPLHPFDES